MKKLICHCGEVELEIKESEGVLNKFLRCNCTLCKKKGYIMTFAPITDVKITKGEDGESINIKLELRSLADVGLVGFPNAGKSTFLNTVSSAKPKIADYPFTTLRPHLGTIKYSDNSFVIADIPGIIEGASDGHGLGIKFLKHISRTGILLFFLEAFSEISAQDQFLKLKKELGDFSEKLLEKEFYIVVTKIDLIDEETRLETLNTFNAKEFTNVFGISSVTGEGVQELLDDISRKIFI